MSIKLSLTVPYHFQDSDITDLQSSIPGLEIIISREERPKSQAGGLIWYGMIFFGEYVATKLLNLFLTLSKEKIKLLFDKKSKLHPENIEKFTLNIPLPNGMIFMDFTNIQTNYDFENAIRTAKKSYDENLMSLKSQGGYFDFTYDVAKKVWVVSKNKSFDV